MFCRALLLPLEVVAGYPLRQLRPQVVFPLLLTPFPLILLPATGPLRHDGTLPHQGLNTFGVERFLMARCRVKNPPSRTAGYHRNGKVWMNKKIPRGERGRVREHERYEREQRCHGDSYKVAHKKALKREHRGLSRHGVARHEGRVGAAVRGSRKR